MADTKTYTSNYNLVKPGQDDFYDVDDFNSNANKVDAELRNAADRDFDHKTATTLDHPDSSVTDAKIGNRTIDDTIQAASGAGLLSNLLGKIGNMIKSITGKANWYTAPATTLQALFDLIVSTPAANKLLKLNADGKLPASITGDADTVDGKHASDFAPGATNIYFQRIYNDDKPYVMVEGKEVIYVGVNCYYDGTQWVRKDTSYGATVITLNKGNTGVASLSYASAGTGAISWVNKTIATIDGTVANADTVDGKHASDFAPKGYGVGATSEIIRNIDLNTVYLGGSYYCVECTNAPALYGTLSVQGDGLTDVTTQQFQSNSNIRFQRSLSNGTWTAWKQIATTDGTVANADTVDNKHASSFAQLATKNTFAERAFFQNSGGSVPGVLFGATGPHFVGLAGGYETLLLNTYSSNSGDPSAIVTSKTVATTDQINNSAYDAGHSFTANGYQKLSNGLILQWGIGTSQTAITFPTAFPNACFSVVAVQGAAGGRQENVFCHDITTTGFYMGEDGVWYANPWIAIGY